MNTRTLLLITYFFNASTLCMSGWSCCLGPRDGCLNDVPARPVGPFGGVSDVPESCTRSSHHCMGRTSAALSCKRSKALHAAPFPRKRQGLDDCFQGLSCRGCIRSSLCMGLALRESWAGERTYLLQCLRSNYPPLMPQILLGHRVSPAIGIHLGLYILQAAACAA